MRYGIFVGTAGGTSMEVAKPLAEAFKIDDDDVINMEDDYDDVDQLLEYDVLFLGSSTWGQGDVHHSWVDALFEIESDGIDFSGKTIALFGAGDCDKHGEHFCSALGKMYNIFSNAGAKIIGFVSKDDYHYEASLAQIGDQFCGLAIDEHNENAKTKPRVSKWIEQLKNELGV
jgi:flavodoxin I